MVVTGLGLLLGARADAGAGPHRRRAGGGRGTGPGRPARPVAAPGRGGRRPSCDDDVLVVARTVGAEGRSRAYLGGRSVPVGLLAELAPELVAVHGQSDQSRLQSPARQRDLLDRYAGDEVAGPLAAYGECFEQLHQVRARLDDVRTRGQERRAEAELLRLRPGRGRGGRPEPGEDVALAAECPGWPTPTRCARRPSCPRLAQRRRRPDGRDRQRGRRCSPRPAARWTRRPRTTRRSRELSSPARRGRLPAGDIAADCGVRRRASRPTRSGWRRSQERLAALRGLTRRYGEGDVDEVLAWAEQARARLADLDDDGTLAERLEAERRRAARPAGRPGRSSARARRRPRPGWRAGRPSWPSWRCRTPGSRSP